MSKNNPKLSQLPCFVCNQKATGDRVNLATATAPISKMGLPEKISQVIGEDFVVVVTEQDVVCKRCVSLLIHMDKLENELTLVKKAIVTYIKQKYSLPLDETLLMPTKKTSNTIVKPERSSENNEIETRSDVNVESPPQNATPLSVGRKRTASRVKEPTPKLKQPALETNTASPKMKIYKCGFCSFQSKELNNVRIHMKLHVKANSKPDDETPTTPMPKPAVPSVQAKRRLFRCQVCSASFDEKIKCLEHISREHTPRKKPLEERKPVQDAPEKEATADVEPMENMEDTVESNLSVVKSELNHTVDDSYTDTTLQCYNETPGNTATTEAEEETPVAKEEEKTNDEDKKMHAIDIEAMIAALHSDGPTEVAP